LRNRDTIKNIISIYINFSLHRINLLLIFKNFNFVFYFFNKDVTSMLIKMETDGITCNKKQKIREKVRTWYRQKKREQDMCARRPRAIVVCGGLNNWRGVIAREETVPGAEDEHRDYPRRFLGPTDQPRSDPGSDPFAMGKR